MGPERSLVLIILLYYLANSLLTNLGGVVPQEITIADSEGLFAVGRRANVLTLDRGSLSLIPGVSDALSLAIIDYLKKEKRPRPRKTGDWEGIKGIGKKKSATISDYVY
jgi:hypothetical protein